MRPTAILNPCSAIVPILLAFLSLGASDAETAKLNLLEAPGGTTLERTIGVDPDTQRPGDYKRLMYQAGWPLVVRQDLAPANPRRAETRRSLVSFVHLTDMHITDPQSPARNPFARKFGIDYRTDFRNQGALTAQVADSMVQRINSLRGGPATGAPLAFAISTGDNGDERQVNELRNYIALLDGSDVIVDTSGEGYVGVQDDFVPPGRADIYDQYWHPDPPPPGIPPDKFKREYGFPEYPGLLRDASTDFHATGLKIPWYSANGNHDGAVVGYFRARAPQNEIYWNSLATGNVPALGSVMFLDLPPGMNIGEFEDCLELPNPDCVANAFSPDRLHRPVPKNPERVQYLSDEFLRLHFASPSRPGPIGHGFTERNLKDNTLYYSFEMAPEIVGIVLDTVNVSGKAGGSIGSIQAKWLEDELIKHSSTYIGTNGDIVSTDNPDKLIVLFSHHNLMRMSNDTSLPGDPDPIKVLGDEIEKTLLRFPNVILWVNGHSHVNRIWSHRSFASTRPLQSAFWEINTASHVDYPQQSRVIEIVDNQDGTLSIFAVAVDHLAPPQASKGPFGILDLAAISRELSANDPDFFMDFQIGDPGDRNVELLIKH